MYYVNERWLGGMLTNFKTIQSRIDRLHAIETMSQDGTFDVLPKKEVIALRKEWDKLEKNLGGIKNMTRIPDAILLLIPRRRESAYRRHILLALPCLASAIPTVIPRSWTTSSPEMTMQSEPLS